MNTRSQALSGMGVLPSALATLALLMATVVKLQAQGMTCSLPGSTPTSLLINAGSRFL